MTYLVTFLNFASKTEKIREVKSLLKSDISKKDKINGILILIFLFITVTALAIVAAFSNLT